MLWNIDRAGRGRWYAGRVAERRTELSDGRKPKPIDVFRVAYDDGDDKWVDPRKDVLALDWQEKTKAILTARGGGAAAAGAGAAAAADADGEAPRKRQKTCLLYTSPSPRDS